MKTWQVLLIGEGFSVDGVVRSCEISGFVNAESVAAAVSSLTPIAVGEIELHWTGKM
ncbi:MULTISPECIES: hypothetical protein [unclassified Acidovorax]|jgi:hypothetical protein|uniref:hypothetical protein n=1 Tax=unclassified Acidovorax TaxID=2684926 RepID=UPI000A75FA7D|nr:MULTISPECIES: hypothetical protein [unclassified Acidovorax]